MIGKCMFAKYLRIIAIICSSLVLLSLSGCSVFMSKEDKLHYKLSKEDRDNTKYKGHYKVGKEYTVKGKKYKPIAVTRYSKEGTASWYGSKHGFHKKRTANGDVYNKELLTAAHRELPMPSLAEVTNLANNKSVIVMINDRGPFSKSREIDVSEKAASVLGFKRQGTAKVRVKYLHAETQDFLKNLGLEKKEGYKAKKKLAKNRCSVNCHIKLVNRKYNTAYSS
jgi:rare lipoprotein A